CVAGLPAKSSSIGNKKQSAPKGALFALMATVSINSEMENKAPFSPRKSPNLALKSDFYSN
ncbi:hypothetical protein, partial [Vibrio cholerae]|uniref:hypothetical protein n=1 Tax=Vibrio cholerae TaxID=666 RepID=UPI001F35E01C